MIEPLLELPAHSRTRLAKALETGVVGPPYTVASLRPILESSADLPAACHALAQLEAAGASGRAIALALDAIDKSAAAQTQPDFVWSGPEVAGLHARDTRAVYAELLGKAERSIWASTFAFFDGPKAFKVLSERMDEIPSLKVVLLLNIQRKWGDSTKAADLVSAFADRFWNKEWPGAQKPDVYYDPRSLKLDGPAGLLHAKAVVADERAVFLTSANFTAAALDRNIEMGLLSRDRTLALTVTAHFQGLIQRGLVELLPSD